VSDAERSLQQVDESWEHATEPTNRSTDIHHHHHHPTARPKGSATVRSEIDRDLDGFREVNIVAFQGHPYSQHALADTLTSLQAAKEIRPADTDRPTGKGAG